MELSDWLAFGQDFTVWTITTEMVCFHIFLSLSSEMQVKWNTKGFQKVEFNFFITAVLVQFYWKP